MERWRRDGPCLFSKTDSYSESEITSNAALCSSERFDCNYLSVLFDRYATKKRSFPFRSINWFISRVSLPLIYLSTSKEKRILQEKVICSESSRLSVIRVYRRLFFRFLKFVASLPFSWPSNARWIRKHWFIDATQTHELLLFKLSQRKHKKDKKVFTSRDEQRRI